MAQEAGQNRAQGGQEKDAPNGDAGGPGTTFNGRLKVKVARGQDTVTVGVAGQAGNLIWANAEARFDGGSGNDILDMLTNGNVFAFEPDIRKFETVT